MRSRNSDEYVMYIVVANDLKMSRGKMVAQCSHVAVKAALNCKQMNPVIFRKWYNGSYTKIVLGADGKTLTKLKEKYTFHCHWVHDEGRTQVTSGSLTAIAFNLTTKDCGQQYYPELKELKLL